MGCGMHGHLELKVDGRWSHFEELDIDRDYRMFERVAGVRGDEKLAVVAPRGIPEDVAPATLYDYEDWSLDAHTPGWIGLGEIHAIALLVGTERMPFLTQVGIYQQVLHSKAIDATDMRIVFWFDN